VAEPYPKLKRQLLGPLAAEKGVSYDYAMLDPGTGPEQHAFHFVACGADILGMFVYKESFPSTDRKTSRRGAKLMRKRFGGDGARRAAIFLAHALASLLYEAVALAGRSDEAKAHLGFRDLIQEHYPLDASTLDLIGRCRAEYRVMEDRQVREEILVGAELGTGYHLALQRGENPDNDPKLVEIQTFYAARYLRSMAGIYAIRLAIGEEAFASIEGQLLLPGSSEPETLASGLGDARWWTDVADSYVQAALDPTPPAPSLDDPTAQSLRERVEDLLDQGGDRPLPAEVVPAANGLVIEFVDNEVDFNLAFDALITGYWLREAEMEGDDWNTFDVQNARKFADWSSEDAVGAVAGGAIVVSDSLPEPFAAHESTWEGLSGWAVKEALDRSWGRHELKMEGGSGPTLSEREVEDAFRLGYGLAFSQTAIAEAASVG
jgi:hypothetical protein